MINAEKVKEQYKVALYDSKNEKSHQQVTSYYKRDYVGKELLKSFFAGTFAFLGLFALYILYNLETVKGSLNSLDFVTTGTGIGLLYVVFMLLYMFITLLVYTVRYNAGRKALRDNAEHLKKLYKMYEREEKLK